MRIAAREHALNLQQHCRHGDLANAEWHRALNISMPGYVSTPVTAHWVSNTVGIRPE